MNRNADPNGNFDLDYDLDSQWHPAARSAGPAAGAGVTAAAAVGSIVYMLPPGCRTTSVNTMSYYQCGGVWYQPQFAGTSVTYVIIQAPY